MREIKTHEIEEMGPTMKVWAIDEPGPGGAHHAFRIDWSPNPSANGDPPETYRNNKPPAYIDIHFQKGPRGETTNNGLLEPALLAICIDRLKSFEAGPFPHPDTTRAREHIEAALRCLQNRVRERLDRGVQGKSAL